jgi:hypothetical protein
MKSLTNLEVEKLVTMNFSNSFNPISEALSNELNERITNEE